MVELDSLSIDDIDRANSALNSWQDAEYTLNKRNSKKGVKQ